MTTKIIGANITDGSVTTDDLNAAAKSSGATDGNAFNIGVLGFKIAVNEGLTIFNLVDGIVDEFNNESGIDTAENVTSPYDSSSDFYSNLDGPNPIPSPQASLTQITSSGPGTFANEPTTTVVKVFALGGGGAGGGGGYGSGGGGGGGAGGVVFDADVPVTGGASVAINVGAGGEGHFQPNHPSYPNPNVSAPFRPVEYPHLLEGLVVQLYLKVVLVQNQAVIQLSAQQLQQKVVEVVDTHILLMNLLKTHYFLA